jgi:hypothetical protein
MANDKVIKLKKPLTGHEGTIDQIRLCEPRGDHFIAFGEPRTFVPRTEQCAS